MFWGNLLVSTYSTQTADHLSSFTRQTFSTFTNTIKYEIRSRSWKQNARYQEYCGKPLYRLNYTLSGGKLLNKLYFELCQIVN